MNDQYRPLSNQEEHNLMMEEEERYEQMMGPSDNKKQKTQTLTKAKDSSEDE